VLESIQPIILVGGRSSRFGRDKLREPLSASTAPAAEWMIDRPIRALRAIFGPRVALVGDCDAEIVARADLIIPDRYPGFGPAGGILSALEAGGGISDVFVLAGDLPQIVANDLRAIIAESLAHPTAARVLASTDSPQPCIGIYRQSLRERLAQRLRDGRRSLHDLVPPACQRLIPIEFAHAININTLEDLRGLADKAGRLPSFVNMNHPVVDPPETTQ
jgi:molybdenum cofactor guanylyltransferase